MPNPTTASTTFAEGTSPAAFVPVATLVEQDAKTDARYATQVTSNPYAAPSHSPQEQASQDTETNGLVSLQKLQLINGFLLGTLITFILGFVFLGLALFVPNCTMLILAVPLAISVNWACVVVLAYLSRSLASAVFSAVFYVFPIFNLIILVSVYDRSRKILKDHGYKCGWLKMELEPETYNQLAKERGMAQVNFTNTAPTEKKERSTTALAITYVVIGLLVGMIVLSILAS